MQYTVPKFIEVEDKVIGPLTLKQFALLATGIGIFIILAYLVSVALAFIVGLPILIFSIIFAFHKPYGRPFSAYFASILQFFVQPKFYLFRRIPQAPKVKVKAEIKPAPKAAPKIVTRSRLKDLAWTLDTGGRKQP